MPKRMREVARPHVLCQMTFAGADEPEMRWGDCIGFVPLDVLLDNPCLGKAVEASVSVSSHKVWKLRFATDRSFPDGEDSREILKIDIDDENLLETMCALCASDEKHFCGKIVGHINLQTEM